MILINLLPHREAARKRRQEAFFAALGASALAGGVIAGAVFLWYAAQISSQQGRNQVLSAEIKRLEGQIKDIATLQQEIAALRARQQAVEDLQADRNMPVYLLNELVRQLPDGVFITTVKQDSQIVTLTGTAQSNERVSELLRNLGNNSQWLTRPELVEIIAANINLTPKEARRVSNFTMKVKLLRASEVALKTGASGASAAAGPVLMASGAVPTTGARPAGSAPALPAASAARPAAPASAASGAKKA